MKRILCGQTKVVRTNQNKKSNLANWHFSTGCNLANWFNLTRISMKLRKHF